MKNRNRGTRISNSGHHNTTKWVRIKLTTKRGIADTLVKARHVNEGIPRDKKGTYLIDIYGDKVYFHDWDADGEYIDPSWVKNKYGGYDRG